MEGLFKANLACKFIYLTSIYIYSDHRTNKLKTDRILVKKALEYVAT